MLTTRDESARAAPGAGTAETSSNAPGGAKLKDRSRAHDLQPAHRSVDRLLDRLADVRAVGPGLWRARCPAHEGRRPALAITQTHDGTILMHCFAGCPIGDVAGAIGLDLADLFPARVEGVHLSKPVRHRFSAAQVLPALAIELLEVIVIVGAILRRGSVTQTEHDRLLRSISRIMIAEGHCHD